MGYSRTPRTIARVKLLLDEMVESEESIEWKFTDARKVAYKLWEAIKFASKSEKKEFKQYANLLEKYKIRVPNGGTIIVELRNNVDPIVPEN